MAVKILENLAENHIEDHFEYKCNLVNLALPKTTKNQTGIFLIKIKILVLEKITVYKFIIIFSINSMKIN